MSHVFKKREFKSLLFDSDIKLNLYNIPLDLLFVIKLHFRLLGAEGDSLGLDGENSLDCGVVPSIDTTHAQMDTGGFNLLQVRALLARGHTRQMVQMRLFSKYKG